MLVDPHLFKDALANWTSGVTIVTTIHEGQWKGTTASSFSSVSLEPPLIMICLGNQLYTRKLVYESGVFAVNILGQGMLEEGKLFAGMYPEIQDRFAGKHILTSETGSPLFADALGWLDCKTYQVHTTGDHTLFIGEVLAAADNNIGQKPTLSYHRRQWGTFSPLE